MSNKSQSAANVYAVLDFVISKALLEGKIGKTHVKVPLVDLVNYGEGVNVSSTAETDLVLKVEIITSWDAGTEELESDFIEEEQDENGF